MPRSALIGANIYMRDENMEEDVEVIFESWLYKYAGFEKQRSVRLTSAWKKKYFVLLRQGNHPVLYYYERKPKSLQEPPKEKFSLYPWFKLERHNGPLKGKEFVCEITTQNKHLCLAAEDEKLFHLFVFFTQTQRKLNESLENDCYVVRPDNSEDHRKLGSRGSMCLLHISKFGITLAVQLSKCVLAQWPLRAIKSYESTGRGQFLFDAGRRGPCGSGLYVFNTRAGQDNIIYDHVDRYVMELAGLKQMVSARSSKPVVMETIEDQHSGLLTLSEVNSDPRFLAHLRKISRDIYDHLLQHIGGSTMSRLNASNPDLLADSQHTISRATSSQAVDVPPAPRMVIRNVTADNNNKGAIPKHSNSVPTTPLTAPHRMIHNHERQDSQLSQMSAASIDSQYLHMNSSSPEPARVSQSSNSSRTSDWYVNTPTKTPPAGYDLAKAPLSPIGEKQRTSRTYQGEIRPEDKPDEYVTPSDTSRYVTQDDVTPRSDFLLLRQQSRSAEDLSEYMRMSMSQGGHSQQGGNSQEGGEVPHSYDNGGFRISNEVALSPEEAGTVEPWLYSYAAPRHQRGGHSLDSNDPYSPPIIGRPPRLDAHPRSNHRGSVGQYSPEDPPDDPDGFATLPSSLHKRHQQQHAKFRKSRSNPNLIDSEDLNSTRSSNVSLDTREDMSRVFVKTRLAQHAHAQQASLTERPLTERRTFNAPNLKLASPGTAGMQGSLQGSHPGTLQGTHISNRTYDYNGTVPTTPKSRSQSRPGSAKSVTGKSPKDARKLSPTTPTTMPGIHVSSKTKVFTKQPAGGESPGQAGTGVGFSPSPGVGGILRRKDSGEHPMQGRRLPSLPPQDPASPPARFKPDIAISETTC